MAARFFKAKAKNTIPGEWGDYGDILQHGMTSHLPWAGGMLSLERTGPYIAPITFPGLGDVVLTDGAKRALEGSGLAGFNFIPVRKALVVQLNWETWDLSTPEPPIFPDYGEPEGYILGHEHSEAAAAALGDLWEISVSKIATIHRPSPVVNSYKELVVVVSSWNGMDLFRSADYGGMLFSERGQEWFSQTWKEFVEFEEFASI